MKKTGTVYQQWPEAATGMLDHPRAHHSSQHVHTSAPLSPALLSTRVKVKMPRDRAHT